MRRYRFSDLQDAGQGQHFLSGLMQGARLYKGSVSYHLPNKVTHDVERPIWKQMKRRFACCREAVGSRSTECANRFAEAIS